MKRTLMLTAIFIGLVFFIGCGEKGTETQKTADKKDEYGNYLQAMKDIKALMGAVESYITFSDEMAVPKANNIQELKALLEPEHIQTCPVKDPWGNDYLFQRIDKDNYTIATAGSDGNFLGYEQIGKYSAQSLSGQDIILKTGEYVFYPE